MLNVLKLMPMPLSGLFVAQSHTRLLEGGDEEELIRSVSKHLHD